MDTEEIDRKLSEFQEGIYQLDKNFTKKRNKRLKINFHPI